MVAKPAGSNFTAGWYGWGVQMYRTENTAQK